MSPSCTVHGAVSMVPEDVTIGVAVACGLRGWGKNWALCTARTRYTSYRYTYKYLKDTMNMNEENGVENPREEP